MIRRNTCLVAFLFVVSASAIAAGPPSFQLAGTRIAGGCDVPVAQRTSDTGCYLVATAPLGNLPAEPQYWHLYQYPTQADAERIAGPRGTVVNSFGRNWVYTIAGKDWKPSSGDRITVLGPFVTSPSKQYTARYMEAVFAPGMQTSVHTHSGAEAWYLVAGAQCLETPSGIIVAKAGEGAMVPEGPPMALSGVGTETRRSVLLVLHDSAQPWMTVTAEWTPTGRCPK
jgi:quercetin dioxygenase-like cupin family protein